MNKPVIPVSRLRPFFGQPLTAGIPRRALGGLSVKRRIPRRFVAGAVVVLGLIPTTPVVASPHNVHRLNFTISSVRNDRGVSRQGRAIRTNIIRYVAPPPSATQFSIFRKPLTPVSRLRPWFGHMPPAVLDSAAITHDLTIYRGSEIVVFGQVHKFGPRLTGQSALVTPKPNTKLSVIQNRWPAFSVTHGGRVFKHRPPRATFALAVNRIPSFKVNNNRSSYIRRQPKGSVIRFGPERNTTIAHGYITIYRGSEIITPGQSYNWQPRRVNFIPAGSQTVPKVLKTYNGIIIHNRIRGFAYRWQPYRFTDTLNVTKSKGIRVVSWRYNGDHNGSVFKITPLKRNPAGAGSLNHGLIRLNNFRVILSVKRENDGGKIDVFSADANGTVVAFNKQFKIVESITVTPLNTALQSAIYDFVHTTQNPTTFLIKLFSSAGARVNGTVSWKARGIL